MSLGSPYGHWRGRRGHRHHGRRGWGPGYGPAYLVDDTCSGCFPGGPCWPYPPFQHAYGSADPAGDVLKPLVLFAVLLGIGLSATDQRARTT